MPTHLSSLTLLLGSIRIQAHALLPACPTVTQGSNHLTSPRSIFMENAAVVHNKKIQSLQSPLGKSVLLVCGFFLPKYEFASKLLSVSQFTDFTNTIICWVNTHDFIYFTWKRNICCFMWGKHWEKCKATWLFSKNTKIKIG